MNTTTTTSTKNKNKNTTSARLEQQYELHKDLGQDNPSHIFFNETPISNDALHQHLEVGSRSFPLLPTSASSTSLPISSGLTQWLYETFWPGMGLFGESYLLFSIGTLRPIWER
jgi:hypothetical protein